MLPVRELGNRSYEPAFTGEGGALIYNDIDPLRMSYMIPLVMRMGDAYVALDPHRRDELPPTVQFTLTIKGAPPERPSFLGGSRPPMRAELLRTTGSGRAGDRLYATHCSDRYLGCVTVYTTLREALADQRQRMRVWLVMGGLLGLCLGLAGMLLYRRRRGIEHQLRRAIRRDALRVVYQPLVALASRRVIGAEALVRWTDEDGLAISPLVFVRIAEEGGFVREITKLVVRHVLADFGECFRAHPEFQVNVNVTASDLTDPAFLPMIEEALMQANLPARHLGIEITESATARQEAAIEAILQLRLRGHRVLIDDFGTGYSSLAYLKDLSVDGIKIDKTFTQTIGTESVTVGILPQILAMAEALRLGVVAEGIETEEHLAYYRRSGPPMTAQGWLFGYPVAAEEFLQRWIAVRGNGGAVLETVGQ